MAKPKTPTVRPTTVYLDADLKRGAQMKGVLTGRSLSSQVNDALRRALQEDEGDLRVFKERAGEPAMDYEEFLAQMKRNGQI